MSTQTYSVKFSDQPYQEERYQQVHEVEEAPLQQSAVQAQQNQQRNYHQDNHQQTNSYHHSQPPVMNNYSSYNPEAQQFYSPHYAHHARMQEQQEIEKQFNYSGSRLRSPHHDPASRVSARLRQNMDLDKQYNSDYYHDQLDGDHCPKHCPHEYIKSQVTSYGLRYHPTSASLKNQSKLMNYPQPFGAGCYTNQLQGRTAHSKTANNFYNSNKRNAYTSHDNFRRSHNTNNSTTILQMMKDKRTSERLREKLYLDERTKTVPKTTIKNGIVENIVSEGEVFMGNSKLMDSVFKLKSLNLLKQHESHINRYSGVGKSPFVFNDYHSKSTNNGYSRQEKGGFFFTR